MPFSYDIDHDDSNRYRRRASRDSESSGRIEVKALGANIGSRARGAAVFDPNAYDGDGDGLVQDSTPFERPAALSNIAGIARGLASRTGSPFSKGWTKGKTEEEIAEQVIAGSPVQLLTNLTAHLAATGYSPAEVQQKVDEVINNVLAANPELSMEETFDFSPEVVDKARKRFAELLRDNPRFREYVDKFGTPPVVMTFPEAAKGESIGGWSGVAWGSSLIQMNTDQLKPKVVARIAGSASKLFGGLTRAALAPRSDVPKTRQFAVSGRFGGFEATMVHEWGHYIHHYAARQHPSPAVREFLATLYERHWMTDRWTMAKLPKEWADIYRFFGDYTGSEETRIDWDAGIHPLVKSNYGYTRPPEYVAEIVAAYMWDEDDDVINEAARDFARSVLDEKPFSGSVRGMASRVYSPQTTGSSLAGKTPQEIAELVVPDSPQGFINLATIHERVLQGDHGAVPNIDQLTSAFDGGIDSLDFSPEAVRDLRAIVTEALSNNPAMLRAVQKYGMPPLAKTKPDTEWNIDAVGISAGDALPVIIFNGEALENIRSDRRNGFIVNGLVEELPMLPGTEGFLIHSDPDETSLLAHEWGHYLVKLAASTHPDQDIRDLAMFYHSETWNWEPFITRGSKLLRALGISQGSPMMDRAAGAKKFRKALESGEPIDWEEYPHTLSQYGQQAPSEAMAEAISAILSGDREAMARVSPRLKEDAMSFLGVDDERSRVVSSAAVMNNRPDNSRGMASRAVVRNENGDRVLSDRTFSPLSGRNWLQNASDEEIAEALVPTSEEDAINLALQNWLYGQDPATISERDIAAMRAFFRDQVFGKVRVLSDGRIMKTPYDYSPEGRAKMKAIVIQALRESPEFAWAVRTFGSVPFVGFSEKEYDEIIQEMALDPNIVMDPNVMGIKGSGMMGYSDGVGIKINTMAGTSLEGFGFSSGNLINKPGRRNMGAGDTFFANVRASLAATVIHEWAHSFWSRTVMGKTNGYFRAAGIDPWVDRKKRLAYMYPGIPEEEAARIGKFLIDSFDPDNSTGIPSPSPRMATTLNEVARVLQRAAASREFTPQEVMELDELLRNYLFSLYPTFDPRRHDPRTFESNVIDWSPNVSRGFEEILRDRFGDERIDRLLTVPWVLEGHYGMTNPQETWAETVTLWAAGAIPDSNGVPNRMREKFLTEEMMDAILKSFGLNREQREMFKKNIGVFLDGTYGVEIFDNYGDSMEFGATRGMASRVSGKTKAMSSVPERIAHDGPEFSRASSVESLISVRRMGSGKIDVSIGDYDFVVPRAELLPNWGAAYSDWISMNGYTGMRDISGQLLGLSRIENGVGNSQLQRAIRDGVVDASSRGITQSVEQVIASTIRTMDEISSGEEVSGRPLYRSLRNLPDESEFISTPIGDEILLPLTSFSHDRRIADDYGNLVGTTSIGDNNNVVLKLAIGANIVSSPYSENIKEFGRYEKGPIESITQGAFRIVSRENDGDTTIVELEHIGVYDTEAERIISVDSSRNKDRIKNQVSLVNAIDEIRSKRRSVSDATTGDELQKIAEEIEVLALRAEEFVRSDIGFTKAETGAMRGMRSSYDVPYNVRDGAERMLKDNMEFLRDNPVTGARGDDLDDVWASEMIQKMRAGSATKEELLDLMNAVIAIVAERIRQDPSQRDEDLRGDVFYYQKLGKRIRRIIQPRADGEAVIDDETRPRNPYPSGRFGWRAARVGAIQERIERGMASRSDRFPSVGKSNDEIAAELELTEEEAQILEDFIPMIWDDVKDLIKEINPGITVSEQELLDSVRVQIGDDGIPYLTAMPHPLLAPMIPDKRDWSRVRQPSRDTLMKINKILVKKYRELELEPDDAPVPTDSSVLKIKQDDAKNSASWGQFAHWLSQRLRSVTSANPPRQPNQRIVRALGERIHSVGGFVRLWARSLVNLNLDSVRHPFGDDETLNMHDIWGHIATGRGFDRHGEWANMLAHWSLIDEWAKENGISEEDALNLKWNLFVQLEAERGGIDFTSLSDEPGEPDTGSVVMQARPKMNHYQRRRIWSALSLEQKREIIKTLDDGNQLPETPSDGYEDAQPSVLTSVMTRDAVHAAGRGMASSIMRHSRFDDGEDGRSGIGLPSPEELDVELRAIAERVTNKEHSRQIMGKIIRPLVEKYREFLNEYGNNGYNGNALELLRELKTLSDKWRKDGFFSRGKFLRDPESIYAVGSILWAIRDWISRSERMRPNNRMENDGVGEIKPSSARGMASRATDFRTPQYGVDVRPEIPNAEIAHADENGNTIQKEVPIGVEVVNPRTGEKMTLDTVESSANYLDMGGDISKVPDAFVIESIYANMRTGVVSVNRLGEPILDMKQTNREDGRFELVSRGSGMYGMNLYRDNLTGAMFGIKYDVSGGYPDDPLDEPILPIGSYAAQTSSDSSWRELVSASVAEELGFGSMPMRAVPRSRFGSKNGEFTGVALITELGHNRHPDIMGVGADVGMVALEANKENGHLDPDRKIIGIDPVSRIMMGALDAILQNNDRNLNNFLIARQKDGTLVVVPIDHGYAIPRRYRVGYAGEWGSLQPSAGEMSNWIFGSPDATEGWLGDLFLMAQLGIDDSLSVDNRLKQVDRFRELLETPGALDALADRIISSARSVDQDRIRALARRAREHIEKLDPNWGGKSMIRGAGDPIEEEMEFLEESVELTIGRINQMASLDRDELAQSMRARIQEVISLEDRTARFRGWERSTPRERSRLAEVGLASDEGSVERGMASKASKRFTKGYSKRFSSQGKPRPAPTGTVKEQTTELIRRSIPRNRSELETALRNSPYAKGRNIKKILQDIDELGVDWDAQKKLYDEAGKSLEEAPGLVQMLGEFDIPLMLITKNAGKRDELRPGRLRSTYWGDTDGEFFYDFGFIAFPAKISRPGPVNRSGVSNRDIIRHELGHSIHSMATSRSKKAKENMKQASLETYERILKILEEAREKGTTSLKMSEISSLSPKDEALARLLSGYAAFNRAEYIAEALRFMLGGPDTPKGKIRIEHLEMLSEFLDIPVSKLMEFIRTNGYGNEPPMRPTAPPRR